MPPEQPEATPSPAPTPAPAPTPSPTPTPTPVAAVVVPLRPAAVEILDAAGLEKSRFKGIILIGLELSLLIALFLVFRSLSRRVLNSATEAMVAREQAAGQVGRVVRLQTLARILDALIVWTLSFVLVVTMLSSLGVNVTTIIGTASVAGLAFGFGAQKLAKDVITGFFILLEDHYAVGEYVTIGAVSGTVEELGLRTTRIVDDEGKVYFLSNGDIAQVCNHSRGPVAGSFEVGIAASADPTQAAAVLEGALAPTGAELGLPEPPQVEGVIAADALKTTLKILFKAPVGKRPAQVAPQLREAARRALLEAGIPLG